MFLGASEQTSGQGVTQSRIKGWEYWAHQLREPLVGWKLGSEVNGHILGVFTLAPRAWRQGDQLPQSWR